MKQTEINLSNREIHYVLRQLKKDFIRKEKMYKANEDFELIERNVQDYYKTLEYIKLCFKI